MDRERLLPQLTPTTHDIAVALRELPTSRVVALALGLTTGGYVILTG